MSRDKQIEEMAKELCKYATSEYCASGRCTIQNCLVNAKALEVLYDKGYRKASDVAEGIFEEIEKFMSPYRYPIIAELKKKYTQDKGRDKISEFGKYSPLSWRNTEE